MQSGIVNGTSSNSGLMLGTIICRHCNRFIDVLDTDRVLIIYSQCGDASCNSTESSSPNQLESK